MRALVAERAFVEAEFGYVGADGGDGRCLEEAAGVLVGEHADNQGRRSRRPGLPFGQGRNFGIGGRLLDGKVIFLCITDKLLDIIFATSVHLPGFEPRITVPKTAVISISPRKLIYYT